MTDTYIAPPKPPLSDPMAEALAEDAAAEAARVAQAAEAAAGATKEPEPTETAPETPVEAAGETTETTEETPPAKKAPATVPAPLLAKERNKRQTAETQLAEAQAQLRAAQDLLAAQGRDPNAAPDPAAPVTQPVTPQTPAQRVYTEAEMQEAAKQYAYMTDLNHRAEQVFNAGKEKFGDWVDGVANLNAMEIMTPGFVEAVMDTGVPVDVIHHLGSDLDEAARISALPPVRMGVELAKIAQTVAATPAKRTISGAPAPIEPVTGRPDPAVNFVKLAESNDMSAWVAERKKAGDPWAGR